MRYFFIVFGVFFLTIPAYGLSLTDAQHDYLAGAYDDAIVKAKSLREDDQSLYFLGLVHLKTANYATAREYFHKLLRRYPRSSFIHRAMLKIGDTYFSEGDYNAAKRMYEELVRDKGSLEVHPSAYLRLAQLASRRGEWEEQKKYLALIREKFPVNSQMNTVETLEGYGGFFTIQVGAFVNQKNALALREELAKNYDPYIVEDTNATPPVYKVRIGKVKSRDEVEKIALKLRQEGYQAKIYP